MIFFCLFLLKTIIWCVESKIHADPLAKSTNLGILIHSRVLMENQWKEIKGTEMDDFKIIKERQTDICRNIFTASYFQLVRGEDWFDILLKENQDMLRNSNPNMFYLMFEETPNLPSSSDGLFMLKEEYTLRNVILDLDDSDEWEERRATFRCLVRKRSSEHLKDYFVTAPSSLEFLDHGTITVPGRFIFSGGERSKLVAFAGDSTILGKGITMEVKNRDDLQELANTWAHRASSSFDSSSE